mmetsp:Transcript_61784/g.186442  ORF Transcript_61784/g.186442 Transcript_61784/m.186442 type:complete len:145 (-) Transcript_61784:82-516(-)
MRRRTLLVALLALLPKCGICVGFRRQHIAGSERAVVARTAGAVAKANSSEDQAPLLPPYELRTEYDHCVSDEFRVRPVSRRDDVALTCFVDCLKAKASYAPRLCPRLCLNALERHHIKEIEICLDVCPKACKRLSMLDTFCPSR